MREGDAMDGADRGMPLADRLALSRTGLANERTLLAYMRTALAIVVIGGSVIKFFSGVWMTELGIVIMLLGGGFGLFGARRFRRVQHEIRSRIE